MADLSGVVEVEDLGPDDSFVDGQRNVQQGSQTLEGVRSFLGSEVSVDPVDHISSLIPSSSAGHQSSDLSLREIFQQVSPEVRSSQTGLRFNPILNVSSRGARAASGLPPRIDSRAGRSVPPAGRQLPPEDPAPWFPRQEGDRLMGRVEQIFDMLNNRDEWSYREHRDYAYPRYRSPVRRVRVPSYERAPPRYYYEREASPSPERRHRPVRRSPPPRTSRRESSRSRPSQARNPAPPPPPRTSRRERSQPRHSAPTPPSESPRRENLQASPVPSSSAWSGFEDEHEEHEAEVEEQAVAEEQPLGEGTIRRLIQE